MQKIQSGAIGFYAAKSWQFNNKDMNAIAIKYIFLRIDNAT